MSCEWTTRRACPSAPKRGWHGWASNDGSIAYRCCCDEGRAAPADLSVLRVGPFEPVGFGWGVRVGIEEVSLLDVSEQNISLFDVRVTKR